MLPVSNIARATAYETIIFFISAPSNARERTIMAVSSAHARHADELNKFLGHENNARKPEAVDLSRSLVFLTVCKGFDAMEQGMPN